MIFSKIESTIEGIIDTFGNDIDIVMVEVSEAISEWILLNDLTTINSLQFDKVLNDILSNAGYFEVVNEFIDNEYDKLFPMIQNNLLIAGVTTSYTTIDLANIMALKALDKNKFSVMASTAGSSLRESLTKYAISNYSAVDVQKDILKEFQGTNLARHSRTIADSSITQFHQSVIDIKAEEFDGLVWFYDGANIDSVTRDYCKCILKAKKYYSEEDKGTMQRNSKRKYNCRHYFYAGTVEYVESLGLKKSNTVSCR